MTNFEKWLYNLFPKEMKTIWSARCEELRIFSVYEIFKNFTDKELMKIYEVYRDDMWRIYHAEILLHHEDSGFIPTEALEWANEGKRPFTHLDLCRFLFDEVVMVIAERNARKGEQN